MKPKKFEKKLVVKKVTITDLTNNEKTMIRAKGTARTRSCEDRCDDITEP
jgi:hypothetical protein